MQIAYMIGPVSPSNGLTLNENLTLAARNYGLLREITHDLCIEIIAPWLLPLLLHLDDDGDPVARARNIAKSCAVAARCDGIIAIGHTHTLTAGMLQEYQANKGWYLSLLGIPYLSLLGIPDPAEIRAAICDAAGIRDMPQH